MTPRFRANPHVLAVMENEWAQLIRNRVVIFTTLVPPFLFVTLALCVLFLSTWIETDSAKISKVAGSMMGGAGNVPQILTNADGLRSALLSPFLVLFLIIPMVVPVTIASYSIVGEKQTRSLEALLSTPLRTWELLCAKALAAAVPAVLATWFSFAIFAIAARFAVSDTLYRQLIVSPTWLLAIVVLSPLFTMLAVGLGIIISSRVRDPNSAQQLGSLLILPLVGTLAAQIAGAVNLDVQLIVAVSVGTAILDSVILLMAVRLFRRETILTHWR